MVTIVPIIAWALAILAAAVDIARAPQLRDRALLCDRLLRWIFFFPLGLMGLWAFIGHVFFAAQAAASIGWQPSPFQFEVGMANLGIGLAGTIGAFMANGFRLGVNVVAAGFLWGAAAGHMRQMIQAGNFAPGNAGPIFYTDILTPLAVFILLWMTRDSGRISNGRP